MKKYKVELYGLTQFYINKINTIKWFKESFHIKNDGDVLFFDDQRDKYVKKIPSDQVTHLMKWLSMCFLTEIIPESMDISFQIYKKGEYLIDWDTHVILHHVTDCVVSAEEEYSLIQI
jgi:hypothetical protein